MSKKKTPPIVVAAEAREAQAREALDAAHSALKNAQDAYHAAVRATKKARIKADSDLPQCRLVSIGWRTGKIVEDCRAVILRKTPGGQLVARRVGDTDDGALRFVWTARARTFTQEWRSSGFVRDTVELRDVPVMFVPVEDSAQ